MYDFTQITDIFSGPSVALSETTRYEANTNQDAFSSAKIFYGVAMSPLQR